MGGWWKSRRSVPNLLIAALPPDEYARVERAIDIVQVKLKQILHKPGEPIDYRPDTALQGARQTVVP
jgi:hypothetical protein